MSFSLIRFLVELLMAFYPHSSGLYLGSKGLEHPRSDILESNPHQQ